MSMQSSSEDSQLSEVDLLDCKETYQQNINQIIGKARTLQNLTEKINTEVGDPIRKKNLNKMTQRLESMILEEGKELICEQENSNNIDSEGNQTVKNLEEKLKDAGEILQIVEEKFLKKLEAVRGKVEEIFIASETTKLAIDLLSETALKKFITNKKKIKKSKDQRSSESEKNKLKAENKIIKEYKSIRSRTDALSNLLREMKKCVIDLEVEMVPHNQKAEALCSMFSDFISKKFQKEKSHGNERMKEKMINFLQNKLELDGEEGDKAKTCIFMSAEECLDLCSKIKSWISEILAKIDALNKEIGNLEDSIRKFNEICDGLRKTRKKKRTRNQEMDAKKLELEERIKRMFGNVCLEKEEDIDEVLIKKKRYIAILEDFDKTIANLIK